jgi:hypothetical protein
MATLSETEKRILRNLHLLGYMGKCGSLKKEQRLNILQKLISEGYLNTSCNLTPKGIKYSL